MATRDGHERWRPGIEARDGHQGWKPGLGDIHFTRKELIPIVVATAVLGKELLENDTFSLRCKAVVAIVNSSSSRDMMLCNY